MDPLIFFVVLTSIYLVLLFFDLFFKSCMHYPYDAFLRNTGLQVNFLRLKWHTNAFNRTILRFGSSSWSKLFTQSFSIGVVIALILMPVGLFILLITLFANNLDTKTATDSSSTTNYKISNVQIEILLPGVNLPIEEIGFYICTLIISTTVHELGHALSAVLEDIPVTGFGFHIYFCIPIAYTEISQEHLLGLKCFKKLRILCGGIWHNVLLALFSYLMFSSFEFVANPIYRINDAVIITDISPTSPLIGGVKGLFQNDIITEINDCRTYDIDSWYSCLLKSIRNRPGYCVSSDFIRLNDESHRVSHGSDGIIQCCDPTNQKQCCFEYIDDLSNDEPIEIPQHVCLDIRKTIEDSSNLCISSCHDQGFCIKPLLRNTTTILILKRRNKTNVIYIGHPADVMKTIKISQFIPKTNLFSPKFGDTIYLFLKYVIVFSMGLAIVNAIPCFGLDGYHITSTIINNLLINRITERSERETVVFAITSLGTIIFLSTIIKILWTSAFSSFF